MLCEDDTFMNLSPKIFTEMIIPLYNRISEEFGGIGIHCCGNYSHLFPALRDNVKNLRAVFINAGENSFEKAVEAFRGTETVIVTRWILNTFKTYQSRIDFIRDTLKTKTDDVTVFIQGHRISPAAREDNVNIMSYEILKILEHYNQYGEVLQEKTWRK